MKILYFAPIYYGDLKQRPQQLAKCLAGKHEVYYIEPTVSLMRWLLKGGRSYKGIKRQLYANLTVIRLNGCLTVHKSLERLDVLGLNNLSEYVQIKKLEQSCDMIWVGYAGWYTLVRHIKNKPLVYDWMDQEEMLVSSRILKDTLIRGRNKLIQKADLVTVTCVKFYKELNGYKNKKTYLLPNAIAKDLLYAKKTTADSCAQGQGKRTKETKKVIFGYVGTISTWYDFEVLTYILQLNPQYEVVLAGKNCMPVYRHSRVTYLGVCPHCELAALIQGFDVCLYNFKQGALLDTINPVKIYEYLAMKKPVLAIDSAETRRFGQYLMLYRKKEDIKHILQNGFKQPFSTNKQYREFVAENTWETRALAIERVLEENFE